MSDIECAICLEQLFDGNACQCLLCGHMFHKGCMTKWKSTGHMASDTCPSCVTRIDKRIDLFTGFYDANRHMKVFADSFGTLNKVACGLQMDEELEDGKDKIMDVFPMENNAAIESFIAASNNVVKLFNQLDENMKAVTRAETKIGQLRKLKKKYRRQLSKQRDENAKAMKKINQLMKFIKLKNGYKRQTKRFF